MKTKYDVWFFYCTLSIVSVKCECDSTVMKFECDTIIQTFYELLQISVNWKSFKVFSGEYTEEEITPSIFVWYTACSNQKKFV